jgi:hypothetical protein
MSRGRASPSGPALTRRVTHDFGTLQNFGGFLPVVLDVPGVKKGNFVSVGFAADSLVLNFIIIASAIATSDDEVTIHIANVDGSPHLLGSQELIILEA